MTITIISSSVRTDRTSHRVALALEKQIAATGNAVSFIDLKELNLPIAEERFQNMANKSEALLQTAQQLQAAEAIIIVTPEYNGSITTALKNLLDIFGKNEFAGKPIGVATVSTGIMGGVRAAYQLQQIILALQAYPQPQMLLTGEVTKQLNELGDVINPVYAPKIATFLNAFLGFAKRFG
jgi:azobenzene reductase